MISAKQIQEGIKNGVVRFIIDPNLGSGTVCSIGDNWFYFGGEAAEVESPKEYLKHTPIEDIVSEVIETLNDFCKHDNTFGDEYKYYESILGESVGSSPSDYERGYRQALNDINTPMGVIMLKWNPSECPRCRKNFSDFEPCDDGYYDRATSMERCPFCGQKLEWRN